MTNLFLQKDDVNVIVIDWGGGSVGLYSQSAANTRLVGLEVAALINYLIVSIFLLFAALLGLYIQRITLETVMVNIAY